MEEQIQAALTAIESEEKAVVLYACESGSRAWGFASGASDYDVRFLYLRPPEWYLSVDIEQKRDVIERPITNELDVNGWDLRKALNLFRKSNPALVEWLGSPIIYLERYTAATRLRELLEDFYSPVACGHHYLRMAQGNFREYLRGDVVWLKKYFYVLRPLLAIQWIERELGVVPTEFARLLDATIPTGEVRKAVDRLLAKKKGGKELERGPRIPELSTFLESELERLERSGFQRAPKPPAIEPLNELFLSELRGVFDST